VCSSDLLLPDGGRGYLGKIFNDRWMRSYGFSEVGDEKTVSDLLASKNGAMPDLVHAHPSDTVRDVVGIMSRYGVSQMPVLSAEPPVVMGEVVGAVEEKALLELVFSGEAQMTDSIERFTGAPLGLIGLNESISTARRALEKNDALLVTSDGKPAAVVTRHDLLAFLSE
jgi:cystathionine beta-synthase